MSQYTNQQSVNGQIQMKDLITLTDDTNTGQLDSGILNQVIANASGVVDMYCANLYGAQLPFSPVPASVANMALILTCYLLYERREVPFEQNKFASRYKSIISFLEKVNTGDMHLNDVPLRDFPQVVMTGRSTIYGTAASNFPSTSM
jgi:phage gp36-like protein